MKRITFSDERIDEVRSGATLTPEERAFLIDDTPRFEECDKSEADLSAMNDCELMNTAYRVWAEYVSCM